MEAASNCSLVRTSRSGRIFQVIFLFTLTLLLQSTLSVASYVGSGGMTAELFHREHPFSRLQSPKALGYAEKLQNDGQRSADRVKALIKRKLYGESTSGAPTNGSTTWQTTLNDAAAAEYLMSFSLGTPPQNFVAVADTASDLTWLQCKPCESCFKQASPVFDPALSSTYQSLNCSSTGCASFLLQYGVGYVTSCATSAQCDYSYLYGDMSNTTGIFSTETIHLKSTSGQNISVPDFWFGCSHSSFSASALYDSADGMIGLGQGLISFPSQLGGVFEEKFSYCLVNRSIVGIQSSPLVFGSDAAPDLALQYTPMLCNVYYPYYYYVGLEGISVGGSPVNYNATALAIDSFGNGGTIIDSGTTFTSLDPLVFDPLLLAIDAKLLSYQRVVLPSYLSYLELCYNVTGNPNYGNDLPTISLKLANNASWDLAPENAWVLLPDIPQLGTFTICLSIMRGLPGIFSIIGSTQQQDFHVLYDRVDETIGFAKTVCGS